MVIQRQLGRSTGADELHKNADGSVRQFGEQSTDEGKTWTPSFDLTYRPVCRVQ